MLVGFGKARRTEFVPSAEVLSCASPHVYGRWLDGSPESQVYMYERCGVRESKSSRVRSAFRLNIDPWFTDPMGDREHRATTDT